MKIIAIGDLHGLDYWKQIVNTQTFDKIIFLGDYFDSFTVDFESQMNNFLDIMAFKDSNEEKVITLLGNHDYAYLPAIYHDTIRGFQYENAGFIGATVKKFLDCDYLKVVHQEDKLIFSHAGVSEVYLDYCFGTKGCKFNEIEENVNHIFKLEPKVLYFNGPEPSGDNLDESPIWIRPRALRLSSKKLSEYGYIQIVGHTKMGSLVCMDNQKHFFIDTMSTSQECLMIEDNKFSVLKCK